MRPSDDDLDLIVNGMEREVGTAYLRSESLKELISTILSAVAIIVFSGGLTAGLWLQGVGSTGGWGPYALLPGGAMLGFLVSVSDSGRHKTPPEPETAAEAPEGKLNPGPRSPGNLHTKGPGADR